MNITIKYNDANTGILLIDYLKENNLEYEIVDSNSSRKHRGQRVSEYKEFFHNNDNVYTSSDLQNKFKTNRRTLLRDIEFMYHHGLIFYKIITITGRPTMIISRDKDFKKLYQ